MDNFATRMKAVLDRSQSEDPESLVVMTARDLRELISRSRTEDDGLKRAAKFLEGSRQATRIRMVQFREMANAVLGVEPVANAPAEEAATDEQTA